MWDDLATFGKQMGIINGMDPLLHILQTSFSEFCSIINGMDPLFPRQDQSNLPIGKLFTSSKWWI